MNSPEKTPIFWLAAVKKLVRIGLLTPAGLVRFARAALSEGFNLMLLLKWAARTYGDRIALTDERDSVSFRDLYDQALRLAAVFQTDFGLRNGGKAAFVCRNHASLIRALFAASRLGADVFLINAEIGPEQFAGLVERHRFDLIVCDRAAENLVAETGVRAVPAYHDEKPSIDTLAKIEAKNGVKLKRGGAGNLTVMTGGTTGRPKAARRKPSVVNFLSPFFALLVRLDLDRYRSAYIATPAYHGFGLAAVILSVLLGIRMHFRERFDAKPGCALIAREKIEIVTLVPLMLQRMLDHDSNALGSLRCVVTGGAPISPALVERTLDTLGDRLFNLFGTSEAGFSILATPADLRRDPRTIGRRIAGVDLKILDPDGRELPPLEIGRIAIKSRWSIGGRVDTGDLGYCDSDGLYFHCGRSDEMVVSAGEKVYPIELETILLKHPDIAEAAVVGIPDAEFGQRLKAFVVPRTGAEIDERAILDWLAGRAARFQMPKSVVVRPALPVTAIGKIDKKALRDSGH
ncbi:MAG: AMP-binding protein [Acidobacteria bacterium]|nr:AMP-binding protein [Acidobacteriota bacterium]